MIITSIKAKFYDPTEIDGLFTYEVPNPGTWAFIPECRFAYDIYVGF